MDAVVTDAHVASAVAGVRALGRAGRRVLVLGPCRSAAGLWSRYAAGRAVAPDARSEPATLVGRVADLLAHEDRVVVYPGGEAALTALLDNASALPASVIVPYPSASNGDLRPLRDKQLLTKLADVAGLRSPETLCCALPSQLTGCALEPCIIKPARPGGDRSATLIRSAEERERLLSQADPSEPLLVQEQIRGDLNVVALVMGRDKEVVARFQQRVIRTWPTDAGVSTLAVSTAPDERLLEALASMLADAGYWGLAQVDVLYSERGPVVIDVNPRFYTSLPLALACGVNLPAAWHSVALDETRPRPSEYPRGVVYRWLEGDLTAAIRGSGAALRATGHPPRVGAMWAPDDPVPSALLAVRSITDRARRRLPLAPSR